MNEIRIGARPLTDQELGLTLPTYEKIEEQMEHMRKTAEKSNDISFQKTNNIGILGCRGAGKTSILQTLRKKIIDKQNGDIVLKIIIPENMSESSTLMENILGLLKQEVDKLEKDYTQTVGYCINKQSKLTELYNNLVRTYTYIQKDYRNILISEFTSENEYVKKSKEVFNSDSEFIQNWSKLLDELIHEKKEQQKNTGKEKSQPMLIVFIDDIDLSTYRCTDVVKTLLSYLSNSNIITFISGDIDTFEEALTLDFLRKEQAMDNGVFHEIFYNGEDNLLTRKKQLAYEYLKKVLPPMYRHQVQVWHLEERGKYIVQTDENSRSLTKLLQDRLCSYIPAEAFEYYDYVDGEARILPYFYHMFDSTSRGLNNVYAVLQQIKKNEDGTIPYEQRKLLIETIIASKPVYNQYRTLLTEEFILLGIDEADCKVDFEKLESYCEFIDPKTETINHEKNRKGNENAINKNENEIGENAFYFCILSFFSAMLLNTENDVLSSELVKKLKFRIFNYIKEERAAIVADFDYLPNPQNTLDGKENLILINRSEEFILKHCLTQILKSQPLILGLVYIDYHVVHDSLFKQEMNEKYIYFLCQAFYSCDTLKKKEVFYELNYEMVYIVAMLSHNSKNLTTKTLFNEKVEKWIEGESGKQAVSKLKYYIGNDNIYCKALIKTFVLNNFAELYTLAVKNIDEAKSSNVSEESDFTKRKHCLYNIDAKNLWDDPMSEMIKSRIETEISFNIKQIVMNSNGINELKLDDSFQEELDAFQEDSKEGKLGQSETVAKKTLRELRELNSTRENIGFSKYIRLKQATEHLAYNNRVWYGRGRARNILNALEKTKFHFDVEPENSILLLYIYYYSKYTVNDDHLKGLKAVDDVLCQFKEELNELLDNNDNMTMDNFIRKLNEGVPENEVITMKELEELFEKKGGDTK